MVKKWDLERLIEEGTLIHGSKYNYNLVTEEDMKLKSRSKFSIYCNICNKSWGTSIQTYIYKKVGCANCKYTLEKNNRYKNIIDNLPIIHGDKIEIININVDKLLTINSLFDVKCNVCNYEWETCNSRLIGNKNGCPRCAGKLIFSYDLLIYRLSEKHGDAFDLSLIPRNVTKSSNINLICKKCDSNFIISVNSSLYSHTRQICPQCKPSYKDVTWTLDTLTDISKEIYGDIFDYSKVSDKDIINFSSVVKIICKVCGYNF